MKTKTIQEKVDEIIKKIFQNSEIKDLINYFEKFRVNFRNQPQPNIYLVGGAVRDALLGKTNKDFDFVIEGMSKENIIDFLEQIPGKSIDVESRNFGVFKHIPQKSNLVFDIALPRIDEYSQYGLGHKDVSTIHHADMTIVDDLSRRDFTINSMAIDLINCKLLDPFNGQKDLEKKLIRAVGEPYLRLVEEDPTRMMRALRFACQLNFQIEKKTFDIICENNKEINKKFTQNISKNGKTINRQTERVSKETLAAELIKGFFANPSEMFLLLDKTKIYKTILNKEAAIVWEGLKKTEQPRNHHSEGNVWNHTLLSLRNIDKLSQNTYGLLPEKSIELILAALFHDFGKVVTIKIDEKGKFTYYNHPEKSAEIATKAIKHLKLFSAFPKEDHLHVDVKNVSFLIKYHMLPFNANPKKMRDGKIAKYFYLGNEEIGQKLLQLAYIDASSTIKENGRQNYSSIENFLKRIKEVKDKLDKFIPPKEKYPVDGQQIKNILSEIINQKNINKKISDGLRQIIKTIIENQRGGKIIGELKELILENALKQPSLFAKGNDKIKLLNSKKVIINYLSKINQQDYVL